MKFVTVTIHDIYYQKREKTCDLEYYQVKSGVYVFVDDKENDLGFNLSIVL